MALFHREVLLLKYNEGRCQTLGCCSWILLWGGLTSSRTRLTRSLANNTTLRKSWRSHLPVNQGWTWVGLPRSGSFFWSDKFSTQTMVSSRSTVVDKSTVGCFHRHFSLAKTLNRLKRACFCNKTFFLKWIVQINVLINQYSSKTLIDKLFWNP